MTHLIDRPIPWPDMPQVWIRCQIEATEDPHNVTVTINSTEYIVDRAFTKDDGEVSAIAIDDLGDAYRVQLPGDGVNGASPIFVVSKRLIVSE